MQRIVWKSQSTRDVPLPIVHSLQIFLLPRPQGRESFLPELPYSIIFNIMAQRYVFFLCKPNRLILNVRTFSPLFSEICKKKLQNYLEIRNKSRTFVAKKY
jgi:hypothetical protein